MLRMPRAVTDGVSTCAGSAVPSSIGPTCRPSAAVFSRLKAMLAASSDGQITRLAASFSRELRKHVLADLGIEGGIAVHLAVDLERGRALVQDLAPPRAILRAEGWSELPNSECDSSATLGWMPKRSTASAASRVISASVSASGSSLT